MHDQPSLALRAAHLTGRITKMLIISAVIGTVLLAMFVAGSVLKSAAPRGAGR